MAVLALAAAAAACATSSAAAACRCAAAAADSRAQAAASRSAAAASLADAAFSFAAAASSLAAAAAPFSSITISPRAWPFSLTSVAPDNSSASVLLADSPEPLTFSSGDAVGISGWIIDSITHRLVPLRPGSDRLTDLSEVRLRRDDNPNRLLAVRGCLVQSPEWSASIRIGNHPDPLSLHSGDQFDAGGIPVRIAAILPAALILANSATSEQLSVPATR